MRKQIPPDMTSEIVEFSKMNPTQRLASIRAGLDVREITVLLFYVPTCSLQVLQYGQSEYVRAFGMNVTPTPISVQARVLAPPILRYGPGSAEATIVTCFCCQLLLVFTDEIHLTETFQWRMEYVSISTYSSIVIRS
jgi:hypothetical protein